MQRIKKDKSMRILLVAPPFYRIFGLYNRYFPIGITTVGTSLATAGHTVLVYDADCNDKPAYMDYTNRTEQFRQYLDSFKDKNNPIWAEVKNTIRNFNPDIVGISIWTTFVASAFHIAKICKEIKPSCAVIMGGPHATIKAEEILKLSLYTDYVIRGDGEITASQLVQHIKDDKINLSAIAGLSYKEDGAIKHNPSRENTRDFDKFPFPDRTLLMNENKYTSEDMGLIMTSRGCPYGCTYCSTDTRRVSNRSIDHVLKEIRLVKERYGTTQFSFKDDSFTVNKARVEELCDKLIKEKINISWECITRVDLVTEYLLKKMKQAGCNCIRIGIESGSERILEAMNKGIILDQVRNASKLFKKVGIHWTGYFMIGVPGETVEDVHKTLDFMYEVKPDFASLEVYEPFPGTPMFTEGIKRGLVKEEMTLDEFFSTFPNHYYKINPKRQVDTIDEERFIFLEKELRECFHNYNKGFKRVFKRALYRSNLYRNEPDILWGDIKKYLRWR